MTQIKGGAKPVNTELLKTIVSIKDILYIAVAVLALLQFDGCDHITKKAEVTDTSNTSVMVVKQQVDDLEKAFMAYQSNLNNQIKGQEKYIALQLKTFKEKLEEINNKLDEQINN